MADGSSNPEGESKLGRVQRIIKPVAGAVRNGVLIVGTVVTGGKAIEYQQNPHQVVDDTAGVVKKLDAGGLDVLKGMSNVFPDGEKVDVGQSNRTSDKLPGKADQVPQESPQPPLVPEDNSSK